MAPWITDHRNPETLIDVSLKSLKNADGSLFTFDLPTGTFRDSSGGVVDDDAISLAVGPGQTGKGSAGVTTYKRSAVLSALVRQQSESGSSRGQGNGLLEKLVDVGSQFSASSKGIFYSRGSSANPGRVAKPKGSNAWVATEYEKNPDGPAAGRATAEPTSTAASFTRDSRVAEFSKIVAQDLENSTTTFVKKNGVEAIPTKSNESNSWVVSGWIQKNPVANAAGSVASTATSVTPTTTQRDGGAGFAGIVAQVDAFCCAVVYRRFCCALLRRAATDIGAPRNCSPCGNLLSTSGNFPVRFGCHCLVNFLQTFADFLVATLVCAWRRGE